MNFDSSWKCDSKYLVWQTMLVRISWLHSNAIFKLLPLAPTMLKRGVSMEGWRSLGTSHMQSAVLESKNVLFFHNKNENKNLITQVLRENFKVLNGFQFEPKLRSKCVNLTELRLSEWTHICWRLQLSCIRDLSAIVYFCILRSKRSACD